MAHVARSVHAEPTPRHTWTRSAPPGGTDPRSVAANRPSLYEVFALNSAPRPPAGPPGARSRHGGSRLGLSLRRPPVPSSDLTIVSEFRKLRLNLISVSNPHQRQFARHRVYGGLGRGGGRLTVPGSCQAPDRTQRRNGSGSGNSRAIWVHTPFVPERRLRANRIRQAYLRSAALRRRRKPGRPDFRKTPSPDRFRGEDAYGQGRAAMLNEMAVPSGTRATPVLDLQRSVVASLDVASGYACGATCRTTGRRSLLGICRCRRFGMFCPK